MLHIKNVTRRWQYPPFCFRICGYLHNTNPYGYIPPYEPKRSFHVRYYIQKTIQKRIKDTEASKILHLITRYIQKIKERVQKEGMQELVHENRGRSSNRKTPKEEGEKIKKILKDNYLDFTLTFAREKIKEKHNESRQRQSSYRELMFNMADRMNIGSKVDREKKILSPPYSQNMKKELFETIIQ